MSVVGCCSWSLYAESILETYSTPSIFGTDDDVLDLICWWMARALPLVCQLKVFVVSATYSVSPSMPLIWSDMIGKCCLLVTVMPLMWWYALIQPIDFFFCIRPLLYFAIIFFIRHAFEAMRKPSLQGFSGSATILDLMQQKSIITPVKWSLYWCYLRICFVDFLWFLG